MFWVVVTAVIVVFGGMYFGFSALINQSDNSLAFKNSTIESQMVEASDYLDRHIKCGSTINQLKRGVSRQLRIKTFPPKEITDDSIVLVKSLDQDYNEFRMESRIDEQTVSFWTRTGSEGLPSSEGVTPFIIYLSRFSKDKIPVEETSLLSRSEFNIVAPYIYSDLDWIGNTTSNYVVGDISFEAYVLAKVQGVLDYVEAAYDNPPVIAYGEGWGSVIARELALVDDRVDLVISTKFPGDPGLILEDQGFKRELDKEWLLDSVYSNSETGCFPRSITSFIALNPRPHIYVGSSLPHTFYSVGEQDLSSFIKIQYLEAGVPENFRYIEGPSFEVTNFEELVLTVYEFIWKVKVKESSPSDPLSKFDEFSSN